MEDHGGRAQTLPVRLVVNAMAYLGAYPDDIELRWPEGAPQNLQAQTQEGNHKQKRTAVSKLAALGFSEINFCGKVIRQQAGASRGGQRGQRTGDATAKNATWVRGHWRRLHHGPKSSLRKLIWLMPVLRNAGADSKDAETGHIYNVSP